MSIAVSQDSFQLIHKLSDDLQLSVRETGELLDIHPRTLLRRQETGRLEEAEVLKAQMVEETFDFAARALGSEEVARKWLFSELPALAFARPIELLTSIKGYERVKTLLGQIVFGSY